MTKIQLQQVQVEKEIPFKLGRFNIRRSSRADTQHLFVFNSDCYAEMVSLLHQRVNARAQLAQATDSFYGLEPDHRILGVDTNDLDVGVRPHREYEVYHIKDCTVEHFRGEPDNGRSYITIINTSLDKREKAINVLEEVFA